jgi:hypothetical protein
VFGKRVQTLNLQTMKNTIWILAIVILPSCSSGQFNIGKIGKEVNKAINTGAPLSNQEVIDGLKQALTIGSQNSSTTASKVDGYFKNPIIKIPFPPQAKKMEQELRSIGMNKQVDDFILTINRAAEEAAKQSAPIFTNAVKEMTITDGMNILKGADTAATGYLRQKTSISLHDKFKPVIRTATQKVDVTKYWTPLITAYNKIPFVEKMNPDLEEYITQRALSGLFYLVSQEEIKIRKDPAARVTDLLKKVFGSQKK